MKAQALISVNNISKIEKPHVTRLEYFMVFLLIAFSGNPLLIYTTEWAGIIAMFIALLVMILKHKKLVSFLFVKWAILFVCLFVCQFLFLKIVSLPANINFFARLFYASMMASLMGGKFRYVYMRIMVFIAMVSLVLWPINFMVAYPGIAVNRYISLIVYNYIPYGIGITRNCGMFWEPGAYQGFLLLVFLLYISEIKSFYKCYRRECVILFLAILSTQSTTGYVVFAIFLFLVIVKNIKSKITKIAVVLVMFVIALYAYTSLDFIGKKIEDEFEESQNLAMGEVSWSRFGSMMIDLEAIRRHPLIGNGFLLESKYGSLGEDMAGAGNGFTDALNTYGIPVMFLYLLGIYKRKSEISKYDGCVCACVIVLLLNGEAFLNFPLFWMLLFIEYPSIIMNLTKRNNEKKMQVNRSTTYCT